MNKIEKIANGIVKSVVEDDKDVVLVATTIEAGHLILQSVFRLLCIRGINFRKYGRDLFVDSKYVKVTTYEQEHNDTLGLRDYVRFDYEF